MILLSIYIIYTIGFITSPSPYKYSNSINKTNQMTANVQPQAISIISKLLQKAKSCQIKHTC